jgi:hypothetical protein
VYGASDVSLYIFHGPESEQFLRNDLLKDWENVQYFKIHLQSMSAAQYSVLTTSKVFYDMFPCKHILIFQSDSLIRRQIDEKYFQYDWVGAPWGYFPYGGNGGFSLRKVEAIKEIARVQGPSWQNEDWFFKDFLNRSAVPTQEIALEFSVESIWHNDPIGIHNFWSYGYNASRIYQLFKDVPGLNLPRIPWLD